MTIGVQQNENNCIYDSRYNGAFITSIRNH